MDIRKIIKEEMDDFKWVSDVEEYVTLTRLGQLEIGNKYYIDYRIGYDNERLKIPVTFMNRPRPNMSSYIFHGPDENGKLRNYLFFKRGYGGGGIQDMIEDGEVFYKKSELKEDVNSFDWTKHVIPTEPEVGMEFTLHGEVCIVKHIDSTEDGEFIGVTFTDSSGSHRLGSYWWKHHVSNGDIGSYNMV